MKNKAYSLLLLLYPKAHRDRFGEEMAQVFEDAHDHAVQNGNLFGFWTHIISDTLRSAAKEHAALLTNNLLNFMNHAFFKPSVSKVLLSAILLLPIYSILMFVSMALSSVLPHPHTNGPSAAIALAIVLVVPAFVSAAASYLCACGLVNIYRITYRPGKIRKLA